MCGIYGVVLSSEKNKSELTAAPQVLAGLKRLEYRGYDSWGIAVVNEQGELQLEKHVGQIGKVQSVQLPPAQMAIGHTRWATHGGVTENNAHPHLASDGLFALVQNGVVENYQELKEQLVQQGHLFTTQTDTEVIVRLIEETLKESQRNALSFPIIAQAFQHLTGRNTISVLSRTGEVFAIRNGSPLVVGRNQAGEVFLASDMLSIAEDADEYAALESGEGVVVQTGKVEVYTAATLQPKEVVWQKVSSHAVVLDKGGYDHFMWKEVHEQPEILYLPLQQDETQLQMLCQRLRAARHVYIVGAGSADFVGQQLAYFLRQQGVAASALKAYEAESFRLLTTADDVCLAVSQSGETADTVEVIEWMKEKGVFITSIVNMPGSTITRLSDLPFMLQIGSEVGIASTKAVTSMMVWGWAVAAMVAGRSLSELQAQVRAYEQQLHLWFADLAVDNHLKQLSHDVLLPAKDLFILGRGQLYAPALEAALKLKEISYLHAEGFSAGELKHGVIALIEPGTPVMCLVAEDSDKAAVLNAASEVKARGARVIGVAAQPNALFDDWIAVPENDQFAFLSAIIPAQVLTYHVALQKGLDPDKPRNLAKSVTVK